MGPLTTRCSPSPNFSHLLVTKQRKGRPDKARDPQAGAPGPRKRLYGTLRRPKEGATRFAGRTVRPDHCADAAEGV
jgi:hypothetical protein